MRTLLAKFAPIALRMITEQIEQGIDIEGKRYRYSTKPFAAPAGSLLKFARLALARNRELRYFRASSGGLWVVVTGGYASYRRAARRLITGDYLTFSGKLLSSMVYQYDDQRITIKFSTPQQAAIAYYLNVSGAGKGRRLWRFLGLTRRNLERLADMMSAELTRGDFAGTIAERLRKSAR